MKKLSKEYMGEKEYIAPNSSSVKKLKKGEKKIIIKDDGKEN